MREEVGHGVADCVQCTVHSAQVSVGGPRQPGSTQMFVNTSTRPRGRGGRGGRGGQDSLPAAASVSLSVGALYKDRAHVSRHIHCCVTGKHTWIPISSPSTQKHHDGSQVVRLSRLHCSQPCRHGASRRSGQQSAAGLREARCRVPEDLHRTAQLAGQLQEHRTVQQGAQRWFRLRAETDFCILQQSARRVERRQRQGQGGAGAEPRQPGAHGRGAPQGAPRRGAAGQRAAREAAGRRAEHRAGVPEARQGGG